MTDTPERRAAAPPLADDLSQVTARSVSRIFQLAGFLAGGVAVFHGLTLTGVQTAMHEIYQAIVVIGGAAVFILSGIWAAVTK